jgi:hypothetical protein
MDGVEPSGTFRKFPILLNSFKVSTDLLGLPTFTFEQGASGGYPIEGEKSQSIDELE